MAGYTRQALADIQNGSVADADDINAEFNQILAAFNASTGHTHDGTAAEGVAITKVGPVQDLIISASQVLPKTTNTLDLGSAIYEFKSAWFDGVVTSDSFVGPLTGAVTGNVTGDVTGTLTGAVLAPNGTAGAPSYSFSSDTTNDTGMYRNGENTIGWSTAGTRKMSLGTNLTIDPGVQLIADASSAAAPGLTFFGAATTGLYAPSSSTIGFSCAGNLKMTLGTSTLTMESGIEIQADYGTSAAPGYAFNGDANTGMYRSDVDTLAWSVGGNTLMALSSNLLYLDTAVQLWGGRGGAASPGYTFNGDSDTGMFSDTLNVLGFTSGGIEQVRLSSTGSMRFGTLSTDNVASTNASPGVTIAQAGAVQVSRDDGTALTLNRYTGTGTIVSLRYEEAQIGSISITGAAVAYNETSDYRLKDEITWPEGVVDDYDPLAYICDISNAMTWFTWKKYPEYGMQLGALAHVLQEVAPHAVSGEKDATIIEIDEDGTEREVPDYQGVDWSKLVPNLVAAVAALKTELDDAKARIAVLEAAK